MKKRKLKKWKVKIKLPDGRIKTKTLHGTSEYHVKDWFRRVSGKTKIKGLRKPKFFPKKAKIVSIKLKKPKTRKVRPRTGIERLLWG